MEELELIDRERLNHGYTTHNFKTYKKHCNKMKRRPTASKNDQALIYKLECNIAKYRMFKSVTFLYKNKRLLKNIDSSFSRMYLRYLACFIANEKGCLDINDLISLRHDLVDYYSFIDDIHLINDNRHDFEPYKVKHMWHDIPVLFETEKVRDSFVNKTFILNDFRFNTKLAIKILNAEDKKEALTGLLVSDRSLLHVFGSVNALYSAVSDLEKFLSDNFVESNYVTELKESSKKVLRFIKSVMEHSNGITVDKAVDLKGLEERIDAFTAPLHFEEVADALEKIKTERKMKPSHVRSLLLGLVEKRLKVDVNSRRMPFSPVFYDLAYDYIDYSSVDNSVAGLLQNFNFSNKN